jgi:hypothetical protein
MIGLPYNDKDCLIPKAGTSYVDWAQLSRYHLKSTYIILFEKSEVSIAFGKHRLRRDINGKN